MIKNYIFDFGNVIAEFYPDRLTEPFVTDTESVNLISEVVFDRVYWDRLDDGSITDEEVKADICKRFPQNLSETACRVFDGWMNTITPVKGMAELINDISKTDKKLYLLSNISKKFARGYSNISWINEIFKHFNGMVFSGEIGIVKPNKEIFEYLLDKYSLKAEECLFVDDNDVNIAAAKNVGISGYLFDGDSEKLRKYIMENMKGVVNNYEQII